eukprot:TRINITY_DN91289_c0_g1_i1.p1 TRINITY_DN91289_c0_g1~~TRINITY_DN91289_c0_g1_i1.p1  ORF type:complete len:440 (+),score=114.69 TRINITY_DN91289_c0_g1_i1:257-1576(+)
MTSRQDLLSSQGSSRRSGSVSSVDCRYEKALRLAEVRMRKEARWPAARLETQLNCRALEAKIEAREASRTEWLESRSTELQAEYQEKVSSAQERHAHVQNHLKLQQERLRAEADEKRRAEEARAEALAQLRADEEALNQENAASRDLRITSNITRATDMRQSRAQAHLRAQDATHRRRQHVEQTLAMERAASNERRKIRAEEASARLRSRSQQIQQRNAEQEARFQQKIQQAEAEKQRRAEIMEQIKQLQLQQAGKFDSIREMAWQAAVTKKEEKLRQELEALVPRLASSPTTPRTPGSGRFVASPASSGRARCSPRASSAQPVAQEKRRASPTGSGGGSRNGDGGSGTSARSASSKSFNLIAPYEDRAQHSAPNSQPGQTAEPISPASGGGFTPSSSRSSFVGKLAPGGRNGPAVSSLQSLGSTRCSLQASATELESA